MAKSFGVYEGKPCVKCGGTLRYIAKRNCVACVRAWSLKNQEVVKARSKAWYGANKDKAQLALGRYDHLELRSNGGIEAGAGCRSVLESDEMEPSQVVVEVFGCHAAPGAQEGLDPLM